MVGINLSSHQVKSLALTCTSICALTYLSKKNSNTVYKSNFINLSNLHIADEYNKWKKYILYNIKCSHFVLKYKMGFRTKLFYVSIVSNDAN